MLKLAITPMLCLVLCAAPSRAQTNDADPPPAAAAAAAVADEAPAVPEQIVVVAQRPGPGMWKVSKGEHVLWVFGTHAPLPKNMEWRSQQVEAVIARSQEYLAPPGAKASPGIFKAITLLPHLIGLRKNPDGALLRDIMPPEDYARWTELKAKYLPGNEDAERERPIFAAEALMRDIMPPEDYARWTELKAKYLPGNEDAERERPIFAAEALMRVARKQAGLDSDEAVRKRVQELVKKNKLKTTSSVVDMPMDNARSMLKNFKKTSLKDVACLTKTMATLETEIAEASARANAWAKGNLDEIRKLDFVERDQACFESIFDSAVFDAEPDFKNMRALMQRRWLAAAENALAANTSTFALMAVKDILDPKGPVAALAAKGYKIEAPD